MVYLGDDVEPKKTKDFSDQQHKLDSLNSQNSMRTHHFDSSSHILSAGINPKASLNMDKIFSQEIDVKLLSSY